MDLVEVKRLEDIDVPLTGHYWGFPEFVWTFGNGLKGARLVKLTNKTSTVYLRARQKSATVINWTGRYNELSFNRTLKDIKECGFESLSFNPTENKFPIPWYWTWVWKSYGSLIDKHDSGDMRWKMRRALGSLDWHTLDECSMSEAIECLNIWRWESEHRHGNIQTALHLQGLPYNRDNNEFSWVMGFGHYLYSTQHHLDIANSRFFVGRDKNDGHVAGVVGGWVNGNLANCMIVKHDFSSKWNITALWTKWTEFVHQDIGCISSDNGTTSDLIKERLGMTKFRAYKPIRYKL